MTGSKAKLAFGWRSLDRATGRVRAGLFDSVNLKKKPTAVGVIMRGKWIIRKNFSPKRHREWSSMESPRGDREEIDLLS
ncbi:MAG: hypothetical protein JO289_23145 [Xanthobacteraceae bacterium]|nr:hypothetical protein [Xanthobacteraceae bacterium]